MENNRSNLQNVNSIGKGRCQQWIRLHRINIRYDNKITADWDNNREVIESKGGGDMPT